MNIFSDDNKGLQSGSPNGVPTPTRPSQTGKLPQFSSHRDSVNFRPGNNTGQTVKTNLLLLRNSLRSIFFFIVYAAPSNVNIEPRPR
jgi:hypothetical protein